MARAVCCQMAPTWSLPFFDSACKVGLTMSAIESMLSAAVAEGKLLESSKSNILALLAGSASDLAERVVSELVAAA
jgi:hypothetical protein